MTLTRGASGFDENTASKGHRSEGWPKPEGELSDLHLSFPSARGRHSIYLIFLFSARVTFYYYHLPGARFALVHRFERLLIMKFNLSVKVSLRSRYVRVCVHVNAWIRSVLSLSALSFSRLHGLHAISRSTEGGRGGVICKSRIP